MKTKKAINVKAILYIVVLVGFALFLLYYRFFLRFDPTFEVNGKEFGMKVYVRELEEMGMCLCQYDGTLVDTAAEKMDAQTVYISSLLVAVKNGDSVDKTGLRVTLVNTEKRAMPYKDCQVRTIGYLVGDQSENVTVKICGQDFSKATGSNIKSLLKETKIPIKESAVDQYLKGKTTEASGKRGDMKAVLSKIDGKLDLTFYRGDIKIKFGK